MAGEEKRTAERPSNAAVERDAAQEALTRIAAIIEHVDTRCMAADGPVTPTLAEMTVQELDHIRGLAHRGNDVVSKRIIAIIADAMTPREMTQAEISAIYALAMGRDESWRP